MWETQARKIPTTGIPATTPPQQIQPFEQQQPLQGQYQHLTCQHNAPYLNIWKRFPNWHYCWSRSHDVFDWHTSATCPQAKPGHVWTATKQNTCGSSYKGEHKTKFASYNYSLPLILNVVSNTSKVGNIQNNQEQQHAMMDSGTTDHFLSIHANVYNIFRHKTK